MSSFDTYCTKIFNNKKYQFWIFFAILTCLSLFVFFYYAPVYKGDDFYFHYRRFQVLIDALFIDKTFPSYLDYRAINGYGYMSNTFYPDVILVPFALLGYLTNAYFAYNFMLVSMTLLCGVLMYYAIDKIYNNRFAAFIASLLYTFSSYRLLDEYNRAALGEYLSFTFLPIIFLGGYYIIKGNYKQWYVLTIGYSLLIYTHILSSVLVSLILIVFLVIYWRSLWKEPKRILYLVIAAISTLAIVSFYLFPMLEQIIEQSFYFQTQAWMEPRYEKLDMIIILKGFISGIIPQSLSYKPAIGVLLILPLFLRFFVRKKSPQIKSADIFVVMGFVLVLLTSVIAPWGRFPLNLLKVIQYPWRLFEFATFFFAVAIAIYSASFTKTRRAKIIVSLITVLAICWVTINNGRFYNQYVRTEKNQLELPSTLNHALGGGLEYIPANTPTLDFILERGDIVETSSLSSETKFVRNGRYANITILSDSVDSVLAPLLYYKGYVASVDGKEVSVKEGKHGFVAIPVDGESTIQVYYKGTLTQKVSFYISLFSVLALCVYIFIFSKEMYKQNKRTKWS